MRTKVEKNHKKAAEEKLKINLPSPKVVLNADECARYLDGTGKTSVLLVEKGGKMVAATTITSDTSASEKNHLKDEAAKTTKSLEKSDCIKLDAKTVSKDANNATANVQKEEAPKPAKDILKPPKKRRGMDKTIEESVQNTAVLNNGDTAPPISPLREAVDTVQKPLVKADLPHKVDSSQKHSVESLLQHQPTSLVSTNNLVLGSYPHHSFDPRTHHLPSTFPSLPSSNSEVIPPYHLTLAQPPSQLYTHCSFNPTSNSQTTLGYTVNNGTPQTFTNNINPATPSLTYLSNQVSNSSTQPLLVPASNSMPRCSNFQQLPEQEEPMNLSKSCKPALGLVTLQSHFTPSLNESRTAEDVSKILVPAQSLTLPPESQLDKHIQVLPKQKGEVKKSKKRSAKTQRANQISSESCNLPPEAAESGKNTSGNQPELASSLKSEVNLTSSVQCEDNVSSIKDDAISLSQVPNQTVGDDVKNDENLPSVPTKNPDNLSSQADTSAVPQPTTQSTEDDPSLPVKGSASDPVVPDVPSVCEADPVQKSKRSHKKKVDVPMDEVSCANRMSRYLLTIEHVISDFVYNPEPIEEFALTEEEAATIRDQFEDNHDTSATKDMPKNETSSADPPVAAVKSQNELPSEKTAPAKSARPPKKRPNVSLQKSDSSGQGSEVKKNDTNIDSVLAFVAADVFNSTPPVESGLGEVENVKKAKKIPAKKESPPVNDSVQDQCESLPNNQNITDSSCPPEEVKSSPNETVADDTPGESVAAGVVIDEKKKASKPKKVQKKSKDVDKALNVSVHNDQVVEADQDKATQESPVKRKKKPGDKPKLPKKKKETSPPIVSSDSAPVSDQDTANRAETSDIGESIASTSGASEQDTPVHELEIKEEHTCLDTESIDKENQDTGLESGGDENKPVRRYKKRLDFVKCSHCEHQARGRSALSRHMKKVHMMDVNMPYKCSHCDYGCTKMASLNRHLFTHGVYPCSRCNFVSDERAKLSQHVMEEHKDKLDMKLCKVCNRYIKCDKTTIEAHTEACQGPTPFKCAECEKEFKYASSLRVHYHTHFPDQPKKFQCEQCGYRTNYKANLHKHHKNMHASKDRDVQCPDCGKLFSTEDNMRRHRKVHTLVRPFACETCKKTFKTSGALKGHQLIHTATRPYSCNIPGCNRSFRTPKFLKSHQEEFHRLVPKKFFCSVDGCNYSFFKRSHLKRHAITHTGERNFHCTWPGCSKSFRHADNLKVHFRSHSNEKPVHCNLCEFKCKQKNSLFWHKKKVHQVIDASVCPRRLGSKVKSMEADQGHDLSESTQSDSDNVAMADEKTSPALLKENNTENSITKPGDSSDETKVDLKENVTEEGKQDGAEKLVVKEQSISTQTPISLDRGPKDLYEFNSDDESDEETPGNFRRDKTAMNSLTPLPPPPKELLRKNEILEMKEKEKKEKAEKREQEKKEKAEKKEQEKRERAEKKEQEKKDKAEKKEQEKKEKNEKREQEKKEKLEKKEQEKKEKAEKKEQEKKEKEEKKLSVKKPTKRKSDSSEVPQEDVENTQEVIEEKKGKKVPPKRKKSTTSTTNEVVEEPEKSTRNNRKKRYPEKSKNKNEEIEEVHEASPPKRKKLSPKKEEVTPISSSRAKKAPVVKVQSKKKVIPPKRKPSARIRAKKKATAKSKLPVKAAKSVKVVQKKRSLRRKSSPRTNEEEPEADLVEEPEVLKDEPKVEEKKKSPGRKSEEQTEVKVSTEEVSTAPARPPSPAYSEEIMLQGKASPYRDFSDAETLEEGSDSEDTEEKPETPKIEKAQSPAMSEPEVVQKTELTEAVENTEYSEDKSVHDHASSVDESSDDEVSNDIPLTPPRAPAPPPMESSEDEMEPEVEPAPFSVPGPNTPFSVPGPNTPISVPPSNSIMQQHSVHSEDAPMSAVPSVPSMEMHSQGSVEMQQSLGSVEMAHPHGSVEMHHPIGSVEMHHPRSVEMHSHNNSGDIRSHGSVEMVQSHGSVEMHGSIQEPMSQPDHRLASVRSPESSGRDAKYEMLPPMHDQTSDADKEFFDQYLKNLSAANNRAANGGLEHPPSGLRELEAMVGKSEIPDLGSKSPISSLPTSVITSLESTLPILTSGDLRARMDAYDRHHESLYVRDTPSSLARLSDRQSPLPPNPSAAFDAFSSLNSLHPGAAAGGRENTFLRQPENLFPTTPVSNSFMAEAMFQRQAMTTPFLPPQPSDRSSLSRIPDTTPLRSNSSSLLRRSGPMPTTDMFTPPTMPQAMPRNPFTNAWASQEARPAHWQTPYLPRQPNMTSAGSFFPSKDNYLTGREFMFDPSVRPSTERGMFPSLSTGQTQDSFQLDRFDLSNYFPNAMPHYGSSTGSLDYGRPTHPAAAKSFDERYRQSASAGIPDFRGLPPSTGSTDMFTGLSGVNSSFNLYASNPMSYHTQHMTDNVNSAFLTHSTSAQHAMFERDYAAAHRGLYPQNSPYPFIDERQYGAPSKLTHSHPVAPTPAPQERDLMSRSGAPEAQMQDPYRSMLYRY
ncbi:uncharacterized protein LOC131952878 [Physella acuta]|uniref:uncharacterized protein LOC131952878 n=1 Tax=Physella acuta TaxID=109671 RepID=UPI0027DDDA8A|nr:uncharacterized protein LOC131952878 [Physella acuta]